MNFDLAPVDLRAKQLADGGDFLAVSPKGQVPVLELDDGARLTEVAVMLQYLADRYLHAKLAPPPGTMERYHLQEWLNFIASELHKTLAPLFRPDTPDAYRPVIKTNLAHRLSHMDARLAEKDYLHGAAFSAADAYAFTILRWTRLHDIDMRDWPQLTAYMERIAARPKVGEAMVAEGLS